jgi:hypothetical protein
MFALGHELPRRPYACRIQLVGEQGILAPSVSGCLARFGSRSLGQICRRRSPSDPLVETDLVVRQGSFDNHIIHNHVKRMVDLSATYRLRALASEQWTAMHRIQASKGSGKIWRSSGTRSRI